MKVDLLETRTVDAAAMAALTDAELLALTNEMLAIQAMDRQMNQLRYYRPVSAKARRPEH